MRRDLQTRLEFAAEERAIAALLSAQDVRDRVPPLFWRRVKATAAALRLH